MKQILEHLVKSLVVAKDSVEIKEDIKDRFVHYHVNVDKADYGKIIGHGGKIAKSIRSIMGAIATIKDVKVVIDIG